MTDPMSHPPSHGETSRVRLVAAIALVAGLIGLAVAWYVTPLRQLTHPAVILAYRDHVRTLPMTPVVVVLGFMVASLFATPATLMIGAAMLLFGPLIGAFYAWFGMMAAAGLDFGIARVAARDLLELWLSRRAGSKIEVLSEKLQRRGFIAVALMRLTPLPFTLQNVMAGASRIRFADYLGGTAIGILPVMVLVAAVTTELDAWLEDPEWDRLAWLAVAVVAALAIGWFIRRWAVRRTADR